jgi:hypothetical protein
VAVPEKQLAKGGSMTREEADPSDETIEDELDLIGEDDEELEPDTSEERTAEANMSDGDFEMVPADDIEFEEDESGVAK